MNGRGTSQEFYWMEELAFTPLTQDDIDEIVAIYAVTASDDTTIDAAQCEKLMIRAFGK